MRTCLGALSVLAVCASALAAQRVWRSNLYPYAYYSTVDGLWGGGHVRLFSPIGFAERPEPEAAALTGDARASVAGSYALEAAFRAPALWSGWRLSLVAEAARANRLGFYGLGNDTPYHADSVTATSPYFYRVSRTQTGIRATLQRRALGPLRVLAGAALERIDFRSLPGRSVFRESAAAGAVDPATIPFTDRVMRAGLVLDTRDNELDPHAGVLLEGLFASGRGYTRTTGAVRLYVHPLERLILAGRLAGEGMGGRPPVAVQMTMQSSEGPCVALGGYHSLRGFYDARFVGPGKLLGGVELRYAAVWVPTVVELMVVGFYDVGRVFGPGEAFRITTQGLHDGAGVEIGLRLLRNALVVLGVGVGRVGGTGGTGGTGSESAQLLFGTRWSY
jgi:Omp85 superfamily domain